jgi:hypothetical protein
MRDRRRPDWKKTNHVKTLPICSSTGKIFLDALVTVSYNSTLLMPSRRSAAVIEETGATKPSGAESLEVSMRTPVTVTERV